MKSSCAGKAVAQEKQLRMESRLRKKGQLEYGIPSWQDFKVV